MEEQGHSSECPSSMAEPSGSEYITDWRDGWGVTAALLFLSP